MFVGKSGAARRPNADTVRHTRALLVAATVAMAASMVGSATVSASVAPCLDGDGERAALVAVNALRAQGAPCADAADVPLAWSPHLAATAAELAADLAWRDELSHVDARQRPLVTRLAAGGYAAARAGENLAAGQRDFAQALEAWRRSPGHCANLMSSQFEEVGLACVERRGSRYERFWVAQLARR